MQKVFIYSTPECQYCKMAKQFFKDNNIQYTDYDVSADDAKAKEMIKKSDQMGTPVIVIKEAGQEKVITGFNQAELSAALGL